MPDTDKPSKRNTEERMHERRERFALCVEDEATRRALAIEDTQFRAGDQWPSEIKNARVGKPCLTVNILPARERQILNDQRQNRPSIHVNPVDDYGDPDTAEILQGIIRHIEYDSNADAAYDTASASQVRGGWGVFRVVPEYESPLEEAAEKASEGAYKGRQVIRIKRVRNPFQCYIDPAAQEADRSDARFSFFVTNYTKEQYEAAFPKSDLAGIDDWESLGARSGNWVAKDGVRVAEYMYRTTERKQVCLYSDGTLRRKDKIRIDPKTQQPILPQGVTIAQEFEAEVPVIRWEKLNGIEILEETELPGSGQWIPNVYVLGDELEIDGKVSLEGMVRHAKDIQRMQNYFASAEVEAIGISKSGSWIAADGQIVREQEWKSNNPKVLYYDPKVVGPGGQALPPPSLVIAEPPIQAITSARQQFAIDFQDVTGIYPAQYGAPSREISGRAIDARKVQGEIGNFHFVDNLTRAIRYAGRIILDWIPDVYDTPRVLRIIGEDGEQKTVKVNEKFQQGSIEKIYDLTVGRYDVTVASGPSYQTKRQESADFMAQVIKAYPQIMGTAGDLVWHNMDVAGARELAEREKARIEMQFPGLIEDQEQDPKAIAMQLQAKLQRSEQEKQAIDAFAKQLQQEKETKAVEMQARVAIERDKAQIQYLLEMARLENARAIAEINAKAQDARERAKLDADLDAKQRVAAHEAAHEVGITAMQQAHDRDMAERGHAQTLEQQEQAGQQAMIQAQQQAELNPPQAGQ